MRRVAMRITAQYVRDFLILAGSVVLAGLVLTFAFYGSVQSSHGFLYSYGLITSGPLGGWFLAAQDHRILSALWNLLPLSLLTFGPLVMALRQPTYRVRWFLV